MPNKPYKIKDNAPVAVNEPATAYRRAHVEPAPAGDWDPNVPFCGTQEEWWEHFLHVERGRFTSLEEANKEFDAWRKNFLTSRLK